MVSAFHGSGVMIEAFDYAFTDIGNDQLGSGFYFTTSLGEAQGYMTSRLNGDVKPGGMLYPTLHEVELSINHPINSTLSRSFSLKDVIAMIRQSPVLDHQLEQWGEIAFTGKEVLIKEAANCYYSKTQTSVIKFFNQLSYDFYPGHTASFFKVIKKMYGYDGVICDFDQHKHYVAWFPEQIKIINRTSILDIALNDGSKAPEAKVVFLLTSQAEANSIIHHWSEVMNVDDRVDNLFEYETESLKKRLLAHPDLVAVGFKMNAQSIDSTLSAKQWLINIKKENLTPLGLINLSMLKEMHSNVHVKKSSP